MSQDDHTKKIGPFARRDLLKSIAAGSLAASAAGDAAAQPVDRECVQPRTPWRHGVEGQRRADLGNGRFLNPIMPGDRSDPTVLKDGDDYYMTYSSMYYYPGIVIWHSRDLVNWTPIGPALRQNLGSIWALDLIKHEGRYYIYIPAVQPREGRSPFNVYVIHADNINGPWSDPVDLNIPAIDPGHVVGEDGKRYLFVNDGRRIRLTDDGLATIGELERVYEGWRYPEDWIVEAYALEGPKFLRKDGWFYMFSAVGGTAGPPTSHMVIVARSRSIHGPWEDCPHNPIVRTTCMDERWWSRGHATPVPSPSGEEWWMVYHGYENGYRTLGRRMLLDPFDWDRDGWPRARGGDVAGPMRKPRGGAAVGEEHRLSDDLTRDRLGVSLAMFRAPANYLNRVRFDDTGLTLQGHGAGPGDSSPLALIVGDQSYEVSVEIEMTGSGEAGLLLFYAPTLLCGVGSSSARSIIYDHSRQPNGVGDAGPSIGSHFHLRVVNDRNVASFYYSRDGATWTRHASIDVSGYHHNMAGGFMSLRPAIYMMGAGEARFQNLRYNGRP